MSGTHTTVAEIPGMGKYACYIRFNEESRPGFYDSTKEDGTPTYPQGGEYWEYESKDPVQIEAAKQAVADDGLLRIAPQNQIA